MGGIPAHMGLSIPSIDNSTNLSVDAVFIFLETSRTQHLSIPLPIIDVQWHVRILCSPMGHRGHNEPISSVDGVNTEIIPTTCVYKCNFVVESYMYVY